MGVNFNRFSMNFSQWKNAISTGNFIFHSYLLNFLSNFLKENFCRSNIKRARRSQSSITFFLYTPFIRRKAFTVFNRLHNSEKTFQSKFSMSKMTNLSSQKGLFLKSAVYKVDAFTMRFGFCWILA